MDKGERAIAIIQMLKQSKHEWAGKKIILSDWQKDYIRNLLAVDPTTGRRKHRRSLLFVPRKNGKSVMISALVVALLLVDGYGLNIASASGTKKQASVVFDEAASMIRQNKALKKRFKIRDSRKTLYYYPEKHPNSPSVYTALAADTDTNLGGNLTHLIADEIQIFPDRTFWEILVQSQATVAEPLAIAIGTAGVFNRESIGYEMYEHAKACIAKPEHDPAFYPCVYEAPGGTKCDYESEAVWKIANPNYGVTIKRQHYEDEVSQCKANPSHLNSVLRWHLNVWVNSENKWLPVGAWNACKATDFKIEDLAGKSCYCGLDLAATSDLCAFVMVFPLGQGRYAVLSEFFCPRESAANREKRDQVPYISWARQKHIHLTEGNIVDYSAIRRRINELRQLYDIREIAADMLYQGVETAQHLQNDGFKVIGFGQGWRSMAAPTKEIEKLVMDKKLVHFGDPVLAWNADNCVTVQDDAGNLKLSKEKSREKIDGMVALAMGLGRAMLYAHYDTLLTGPLAI